MFRDGLHGNVHRRVREEDALKKKDPCNPISTQGVKVNPLSISRNGGKGFGLSPPSKFQSGHFPLNGLPKSKPIQAGRFGSDMDISSDSDELYGREYSVDTSPQDRKIPNGSGEKFHRKPGRTEDELSDSATSTEVSFTQGRSNDDGTLQKGARSSDGFSFTVPTRENVGNSSKQDLYNGALQSKRMSYNGVPSAPPFYSASEFEQVTEQHSSFGSSSIPLPASTNKPNSAGAIVNETRLQDSNENAIPNPSTRSDVGVEVNASASSFPARLPNFHASELGPWYAVIAYDACVRLCLHSWAMGFAEEAPYFLCNECGLLRNAFGLQRVLLQPEEELLTKKTSELASEATVPKSRRTFGKLKVQIRRIKMGLDPPPGCSFMSLPPPMLRLDSLREHVSHLNATLSSGWKAIKTVRVTPRTPVNGSFSRQSLAYLQAGTQYIKQVSRVLKNEIITLQNSSASYEVVQESYSCLLRLKSSPEEDQVRMQPGSGEAHVFLPDSLGDDLIIEVQDSKGQHYGRVMAQVTAIADDPGDKLRWWPIYHEPEHELVGRIQLYINYSCQDESNQNKCGSVAETVAYDLVLEVAMKVQHFQQRNLLLNGQWKWLVNEFASYYGISDAYTKLRYLTYVMDVATPTKDCLDLIHDLLSPVVRKGNGKNVLSHQENRILGEIDEQVQEILRLVFENYKSLNEALPSGIVDVFGPATGSPAPALAPAVKLYSLLHDILNPESQLKLCRYFQAAVKKRSRRHLAETDEAILSSNEGTLIDPLIASTSYQKMKSLILSFGNEIQTDIEIHNQHVFPSFLDLPNLSASIYSVELSSRLRAFLVACPPSGPSPPVTELVIATADFQRDLSRWNINPIKGGVNAKELFHYYISLWIEGKRLALLDSCKLDKVKWCGVRTQHLTTPFVDDMYNLLKETLNEYEIIILQWPEYTIALENVIADTERAILDALDKQYADVLSPIKDNLNPKIFGLKYVQKLAKGTTNIYFVPDELGILLNSMKRMLDVLQPRIETQLKSWSSCIPDGGSGVPGERLSEVTVMLRAKFRNYLQAIVEKLAENTRIQSVTKLKKIIQDLKDTMAESDVRCQMQPLKDLLVKTIDNLYSVFEPHVFIAICRGFWDRMGQDILRFLEDRKDNKSWYKGSRISASILDEIFASQMQQLLGNALQEKDLEPPRSIMEVRSMLCKDSVNYNDNYYY